VHGVLSNIFRGKRRFNMSSLGRLTPSKMLLLSNSFPQTFWEISTMASGRLTELPLILPKVSIFRTSVPYSLVGVGRNNQRLH
jgi:hypothetical protein